MLTILIIKKLFNYVILKKKKTLKFKFIFAKPNKEIQDDTSINDLESKRFLDIA